MKGKVGKMILRIICILLAVVVAALGTIAILNFVTTKSKLKMATSFEKVKYENQLFPVKDMDGYWSFTTDKDLKVMQLTDVHFGGGVFSNKKDKKAINAVASMIMAEKPDLVIVTGDIAYPVPFQSGTLNNKNGAKIFAEMMETLGVYWTVTFGNHDTEFYSYFTRDDIGKFYSENYEYCIFQMGDDNADGCGNSVINVRNSKGVITQSLVTIDSNAYIDKVGTKGYDKIHDNQIEWYENTIKALNEENTKTIKSLENPTEFEIFKNVKSLAFFHIPMQEFQTAWTEFENNGKKDTKDVKYYYGELNENVCSSNESDKMFETIQKLGSTQGVFCGHDHVNNFSLDYKGIRLTYGYSIDYLAYFGLDKKPEYRGCTIITVSPDGSFDCHLESYYQSKYKSQYPKEVLQPSK